MKNPKECAHPRVNRVVDVWLCNDCGTEFRPVNGKLRNPWSVEVKAIMANLEKMRESRPGGDVAVGP
jgi:ribosomal protein L37AE/L43A